MYYEHFGLTQPPFRITPNTDFFFAGGNRGAILDALIYAVSHGEGIVKVTGEVGSGKTMLCSMLQSRLPANVENVYLANPSVAPEEVLHAIAVELHLGLPRTADHLTVMHALQDFLLHRYAEHKRVVIFVEESQSMPIATLEEIRLLSNLETRNEKLLQIVLFGQPELDEILRQPNIRQLRDRIAHSFRLDPLSVEEVREYLSFRMRAAGYKGPEVFSLRIVKEIARASSGLTRRVNLIADKALLAAFAENTHTIRSKHVKAALRDTEFAARPTQTQTYSRFAWPAVTAALGLAAGASIYAVLAHTGASAHSPSPSNAAKPAAMGAQAAPASAPVADPKIATESTALITTQPPVSQAALQPQKPPESAAKEDAPILLAGPAVAAQRPEPLQLPPATAPGPGENWLTLRTAATEQWLKKQPGAIYTVQLLGGSDEHLLKEHLNVLSKSIEMQKIFVYRVDARGKPWVNVLYGAFEDRPEAQRALEALPPALKAYKPVLRTVQGIRTDVSRQSGS